MSWYNVKLIFLREIRDQLRDRRTLFMITILPVLLYPMLGLGMVQMMLMFNQARRTVVVLGADQLPGEPQLLADGEFVSGKIADGTLRVVTDIPGHSDADKTEEQSGGAADRFDGTDSAPGGRNAATAAELLKYAGSLRRIADEHLSESPSEENVAADSEVTFTDQQLNAFRSAAGAAFRQSGIDVLVIVPEGYAEAVASFQQTLNSPADGASAPAVTIPPLLVLRNTADDKSMAAFVAIREELMSWEHDLRRKTLSDAGLPSSLEAPASLQWIELAEQQQVAASVWSKLFPALLVIMALTGAFYPAIDLGAGEKERGTMETLLICPATRLEVVLGKFCTIMLFSMATALLNILSMGLTGQHMVSMLTGIGSATQVSLDFPPATSLIWVVLLLIPLSALFSALCLALATFAKSSKEGQYYLTPLLMVTLGLTLFCLSPTMEMTPLYSLLPVVNITLLLKGMLLGASETQHLLIYIAPVLVSSLGYGLLALWWAIDLYGREEVLFREAERFDLRLWLKQMARRKEPVPAFSEGAFCFIVILLLQFMAMRFFASDPAAPDFGQQMLRMLVVQQLTMIACPALIMGIILTSSPRVTFRLRIPSAKAMMIAVALAFCVHPLSIELAHSLKDWFFGPLPDAVQRVNQQMASVEHPRWVLLLVFALTPAVCEELAFRGFILSGLARGGRLAIAIVISSLMFGIIHMIPQQAFNAALLGMILGLIAIYSRSIFPAIAFHFCNNAIAVIHSRELVHFERHPVLRWVARMDPESGLRYQPLFLVLCAAITFALVATMIHDLQRERAVIQRRKAEARLAGTRAAQTVTA